MELTPSKRKPIISVLAKTEAAVVSKLDDLLDAIAGIAAAIGKHDRLAEPLGSKEQIDAKGLKMQIWPWRRLAENFRAVCAPAAPSSPNVHVRSRHSSRDVN